jgi:hypothetical protein
VTWAGVYGGFSIRFFAICTLVCCGVLIPLNYSDSYIADHPSGKEGEDGTLEKMTILNISVGSSRYAHLGCVSLWCNSVSVSDRLLNWMCVSYDVWGVSVCVTGCGFI